MDQESSEIELVCVCAGEGGEGRLGCGILRVEQPAKCSWIARIVRQAWFARGEVFSAAGKGRAEGEHSSAFSCCYCHRSTMPEFPFVSCFFSFFQEE